MGNLPDHPGTGRGCGDDGAMSRGDVPPLRERILGLVVFGWAVALVRFFLDLTVPEHAMGFGVYFAMPVAFAYVGLTGRWGRVRWWPTIPGTMLVLALLVWGAVNWPVYTAAQFLGWEHGRFAPDRAPPLQDDALGKVIAGLSYAALSTLAATVWCTLWATLLIWLPARLRREPKP